MPSENPFEAPSTAADDGPGGQRDFDLRVRYERAEKRIQRVASWLLFAGAFACLMAASQVYVGFKVMQHRAADHAPFLVGTALLGLGSLQLWSGWRMWDGAPSARLPGAVAIAPCLAAFPVGTYVALRCLHALLSEGGRTVLSDRYQQARAHAAGHARWRRFVPILSPLVLLGLFWGMYQVIAMPHGAR